VSHLCGRRLAAALAVAGAALGVRDTSAHVTTSAIKADVQTATLPNGLRLVVVPRSGAPLVAANLSVRAGAVDDAPGQFGMAHLVEHVTTTTVRASRTRPQGSYVETLERRGAIGVNATTTWDVTQYFAQFPVGVLPLWFELEATRLRDPLFDGFDAERAAAAEEARQSTTWDDWRPLFRRVFPESDTLHAPFGVPDEIERIDRESVAAFMQRIYRPDRIVITLVGAIEPAQARALCERWFGSWRPPSRPAPRRDDSVALMAIVPALDSIAAHALIGVPRESAPVADAAAFDVLATLVNTDPLARLTLSAAARAGLQRARAISAFPGLRETSAFTLIVSGTRGSDVRRMASETISALQHAPDRALTGAALLAQGSLAEKLDDDAALAAALGRYETIYGNARRVFDELDALSTITAGAVRAAAARLLQHEVM
jgi:predicted Zn-dependent peptidase